MVVCWNVPNVAQTELVFHAFPSVPKTEVTWTVEIFAVTKELVFLAHPLFALEMTEKSFWTVEISAARTTNVFHALPVQLMVVILTVECFAVRMASALNVLLVQKMVA